MRQVYLLSMIGFGGGRGLTDGRVGLRCDVLPGLRVTQIRPKYENHSLIRPAPLFERWLVRRSRRVRVESQGDERTIEAALRDMQP